MESTALAEMAGQLVLVRLLVPSKKPPAPATVMKDVSALFAHRMTTAEAGAAFDAALDRLEQSQLITRKPLALTSKGGRRAREFLGVSQLPEKLAWTVLKKTWLTAKALGGVHPNRVAGLKNAPQLQAAIVSRHYNLPAGSSLEPLLHRLAWRQLGVESELPFTRANVLARLIGLHRPPTKAQLKNQMVNQAVGATKTLELHDATIRRWLVDAALDAGRAGPPSRAKTGKKPKPLELTAFARAVQEAARRSPTGWFGDNKVFIWHVWEQWRRRAPDTDITVFKERLVQAHQQGLLRLSRADLVDGLNPSDLAASETRYLTATFHYIRIEPEESRHATVIGS